MWFDMLMDDFKECLEVSATNKGVFVPVFLKLLLFFIMGILLVAASGAAALWGVFISEINVASLVASAIIVIFVLYVSYIVLWALIEVGSINLYRAALLGEKPRKEHFFRGIKSYMGKVFGGKLLLHFLVTILTPVWLALLIIYSIFAGILTGGWAIVFLFAALGAYFATWTMAIVEDDLGVAAGFGASFRLARDHFKPMFVLVLSMSMVMKFAVGILGPVGFIVAGWLIGGAVKTYFRIILLRTYIRYKRTPV